MNSRSAASRHLKNESQNMTRESKLDHRSTVSSATHGRLDISSQGEAETYGAQVLRAAKDTRSDASDVVMRLSHIVVRLCGSIPPIPLDEMKEPAAPSGLLAEIKDANDGTRLAIGDIFHMLDVLESTV